MMAKLRLPFTLPMLAAVLASLALAAPAAAQGLTYVDVDSGIVSGAPNLSPLSVIVFGSTAGNNQWGIRGFAADGTILASIGADMPPELTQTISGLSYST